MRVSLLDRSLQFLSGAIIVVCLLVIFTALINMYQSGERLTKTIEEQKSGLNYEISHAHNDLVESLDGINKKLDETNMLLKQIQNEVEKR
ncbi:hypothetical protein GNO57_17845 [Escherichia coli]|nr:hypothetical protein [Escherichia coli]